MKKRYFTILFFIICLICFSPISVFGGSGVVRLNYVKPGVSFKIYRIGGFNGSGVFDVDDDFSGYGIDFENTEAAQTLAAYIERDNIPEEGQSATGSDSVVVFSGLESGYYLILGETYNDGDYIYTALPVMLTVYEGEVIEVSGKYEMTDLSSDNNYQSISALKVWSGGSLDSITVQLLRDGEVYDEQTLNSDGNWRYTWSGLDLVHTWTVTEKEIPSGYSLSIEKDGQVYILQNTKDSDTPSGGETTTEAKTEATTEAKTETTTKKPSGGGGGGGGSVVVNPEETTEAAVETTTESDSESGTESETEEEEITEEDVEDTMEKKNDDSDDDDNSDDSDNEDDNGGSDGGSDSSSEPVTDEYGRVIEESQVGDNSGMGSDSSASSSSASVSSDSSAASSSSAGAASGASVSSDDSARLPQTGQLWYPVPILSCLGVFLLILGIGRRRMS